ncbi:MAG: DUF3054 domain-containing protein [Chloroflexales bacterium]|nr:DUF3054 domain-containing protein [Chloroflexales bacterium]
MATKSTNVRATGGRTAALAAGDVLVLLVFAAIGRRSHGEAAGLAAVGEVALTALPFIAGWLAVAPLTGAFSPARTAGVGAMLKTTLLGWAGGLLVGAVLRAVMVGRFSPLSFYVVTFLAALMLLGGWRAAFAMVEERRATR